MGVHTEADIVIDRPIEEVFDVAADFGRAGEWRKGIRDAGLVGSAWIHRLASVTGR